MSDDRRVGKEALERLLSAITIFDDDVKDLTNQMKSDISAAEETCVDKTCKKVFEIMRISIDNIVNVSDMEHDKSNIKRAIQRLEGNGNN